MSLLLIHWVISSNSVKSCASKLRMCLSVLTAGLKQKLQYSIQ